MLALALLLAVQDRPMLPAPDTVGEGSGAGAARRCDPGSEEITVCGNADMSRFRAGPLDDARWAEKPLRPRFKLPGGGQGAVHAEQRSLPGASAPAAMVTLKIPLGGKKKPEK